MGSNSFGSRQRAFDTLTLVISVFGDERSVIAAIEAGAQGYLLKSEAPEDLRLCVEQVLAGASPISPGIAAHVLRRFRETAPESKAGERGLLLTQREFQVPELMVKGSASRAAPWRGTSRRSTRSSKSLRAARPSTRR